MSIQYLVNLYIWLRHIYLASTAWENEIAENCLHIMSHFRNVRFMWREHEVWL